MSPVTLNIVAIAIFSITMMSLFGGIFGLSPAIPAAITFGLMGIATVDTLALEGRMGTLLTDGFSQFSEDHRQRVLHHEAGHFFIAHCLGIPVTDYSLSAWEAFRKGQPGRGGVQFSTDNLNEQLQQGALAAETVETYCTVWMAGIAAEQLVYGRAEGGFDDRQSLRILWQQFQRPQAECEVKSRWAALKAKTILESHRDEYDALVEAMNRRAPVDECVEVLPESVAIASLT